MADALDERAAACEEAARGADGTLPSTDALTDAPLTRFSRAQWRDAGAAAVLREVANALRRKELPMLRARTWLLAWQVECDCAAEDAMARVARAEGATQREAEVARSAFVLGRAKGAKVAAEVCGAVPAAL
ncbi:MAG TPA: hypothetical protein VGX28_10185 [Frankiaceae bacterium]|nr:hypothetical protein [Frankiaceae bacterium]